MIVRRMIALRIAALLISVIELLSMPMRINPY